MDVGQVKTHDQVVKEVLQQHSQSPSVNWERFLPRQSLKVLLVENDDSTRHVVGALLTNCGYEVTAVADGLQAWKLLEDITNHVDLVVSEVVMPCLSGIGLLSKIMSHKTFKNIPVIMMSCHDSMNVVFKCLSKGAVDFLVKPIRKNELKNLWQHVWRRCHSSSGSGSGSGSESGVQTQKFTKAKSAEDSDNQSGSNDEDDNGSIGLNARNGSDNGSGTQSCWTERAVEVESPKPMPPWDKIAEPPDSTCAQVTHSWPEEFGTNWVPTTATKGCDGQEDEYENIVTGKDLGVGVPRIPNMQQEGKSKMISIAANNGEILSQRNAKKDDEQLNKGNLKLNSEKANGESRNQVADVMGVLTDSTDPQVESAIFDKSNNLSKPPSTKDKSVSESKFPSLELSLKRIRDVGDTDTAHDRSILRQSAFSAFSRYHSGSTANQTVTANVGSCSPFDNSSEAAKTESMQNLQSNSNSTPPNQRSNGSTNNNDVGSTTNNAFSKLPGNELAPKSTVKRMQAAERSSASAQNEHVPLPPMKTDALNANSNSSALNANSTSEQPGCSNQQVQVQHHHHHYHHHHHHVHNIPKQQQQLTHHEDLTLKAVAPHCGSSNMQRTQKVPDYILNGNGSGSDQGSNGQNSSSRVMYTKGPKTDNDDTVTGKGGINIGNGFGGRIGCDQNHVTQREAALNKFRQKRKERCFEKKVRYHSRRKLAEQRPRIRGQFVRQVQEK